MKTIYSIRSVLPALVATLFVLSFSHAAQASATDDALLIRTSVTMGDNTPGDEFNSAAQLAAGNAAYARGEYDKAFRIYRNIAVLGIAEAHYHLGLMYAEGLGTRKSARQAEYWLQLAAKQNYPGAAAALTSVKAAAAQI